jgi:AcrR family transcriptional regulator
MADLALRSQTTGIKELGETRAALVIAHPGHELRLYGWIAQLRPRVFVLTDGSGRSQQSRLEHTTTILDRLGATKGSVYGRFTDAAIYRALLEHDFNLFTQLAAEITETIVKEELTCVAGDASEGYNPTHDACRLLVNAALAMARERYERNITNLEFMVTGQPNGRVATGTAQRVKLDQPTFEEKLATARSYPGLGDDVEDLLRKYSEQAFRTEYLYPAVNGGDHSSSHQGPPDYERHGERRVRDGYYEQVIRYREHILPLARKLHGESRGGSG